MPHVGPSEKLRASMISPCVPPGGVRCCIRNEWKVRGRFVFVLLRCRWSGLNTNLPCVSRNGQRSGCVLRVEARLRAERPSTL